MLVLQANPAAQPANQGGQANPAGGAAQPAGQGNQADPNNAAQAITWKSSSTGKPSRSRK